MTWNHRTRHRTSISFWIGVLSFVFGFPIGGFAMGYGDHHSSSVHGMYPHGSGPYSHSQIDHGRSMSGGYGMGGGVHSSGHGPHQTASEFIAHILQYKDGMAITDEQAAKLQAIRTGFEKTKIKMKADMQLASLDLHEVLRNDQSDLSAVESQLKNLYEIRAGLYLASVKAGREAKAVLTEEQRARMKAVHDRINSYKEGGKTKGHPGDYSPHSKDKQS
jgi:Spy/CpxP family protein refolding chaperone